MTDIADRAGIQANNNTST